MIVANAHINSASLPMTRPVLHPYSLATNNEYNRQPLENRNVLEDTSDVAVRPPLGCSFECKDSTLMLRTKQVCATTRAFSPFGYEHLFYQTLGFLV